MSELTKQEMVEQATQKLVDLVNQLGGDAYATIVDHGKWKEFKIEGEIGREKGLFELIMETLH